MAIYRSGGQTDLEGPPLIIAVVAVQSPNHQQQSISNHQRHLHTHLVRARGTARRAAICSAGAMVTLCFLLWISSGVPIKILRLA